MSEGTDWQDYPALGAAPAGADTFLVNDTSDHSASSAGTVKQVTVAELLSGAIPPGLDADKPDAATVGAGASYWATDTQVLYRSDGTAWQVSLSSAEGASAPTPAVFPDLTFILPPGSAASAVTASGITVTTDTTDFDWGSQSIKCITDGAGGTGFVTLTLGSPVDLSDKVLVVGLEIDSFTPYNDLQIRVSSGGDTANFDFCRPAYSSGSQRWFEAGLWERVTINRGPIATNMGPGQYTAGGTGLADPTSVNLIRFKAVDNGGSAAMTFRIGFIGYYTRPAQGMVSITFDDSRLTQFTVAKPAMDAVGIRGTIYNIAEVVSLAHSGSPYTGNYFDETQLRQFMDDSGWEMGAHAYTDVLGVQAHTVGYDSLTAHDGETDVVQLKTWMRQQRALGIDSMALPHGQWSLNINNVVGANPAVLDMMGKYFNTCVTTAANLIETYPPANRLKLRRYVASSTDTATTLMEMVTNAVNNHQWLILAFHNLVSPAVSNTDFLPTEFASFITQLAASGVATPTVGEVWRQAGIPSWVQSGGGGGGASLDALATEFPTAGSVAMNGHKLTGAAAGSTAGDGTTWEQLAGPSPADAGLLAWTGDPAWMGTTAAVLATAGTVYVTKFSNRKVQTFTNLLYYVGTMGGTLTTGQCFAGIYDSSGTLRATTADQSVNFGATGLKTAAFATPYANAPVGTYYVAFMFNGTLGPAFKGASAPGSLYNAGLSGASLRCATTSSTGNTTALPSTITPSANASGGSVPAWGAIT